MWNVIKTIVSVPFVLLAFNAFGYLLFGIPPEIEATRWTVLGLLAVSGSTAVYLNGHWLCAEKTEPEVRIVYRPAPPREAPRRDRPQPKTEIIRGRCQHCGSTDIDIERI